MKYNKFLDFLLSIFGLNTHFTVIVENHSATEREVVLFGANEFLNKPKFGLPENIKVRVQWWGYKRLLKRLVENPFYVGGFKIKSKSEIQLQKYITFKRDDLNFTTSVTPINISSYISPYQEELNMVDVNPYTEKFDEKLRIIMDILPNEKVKITFEKTLQVQNKEHYQPKQNPSITLMPHTAL